MHKRTRVRALLRAWFLGTVDDASANLELVIVGFIVVFGLVWTLT